MRAQAVLMGLLQILKGMGAAPADSAPLTTSALDSLGALEMRDAVASRFAATLPSTAAYDYPDLPVRMSTAMHLQGGLHCSGEDAAIIAVSSMSAYCAGLGSTSHCCNAARPKAW